MSYPRIFLTSLVLFILCIALATVAKGDLSMAVHSPWPLLSPVPLVVLLLLLPWATANTLSETTCGQAVEGVIVSAVSTALCWAAFYLPYHL